MGTYLDYLNQPRTGPAPSATAPGPTTSGANPSGRDQGGAYTIFNPAPGRPRPPTNWSGVGGQVGGYQRPPGGQTPPGGAQPPPASAPPAGPPQDMAPPTFLEDLWKKRQGDFEKQSPIGQYWQGVQGQFNKGLPEDPGFGSYYDRAFQRAGEKINTSAGARGMYKGSATMGHLGEAAADLEGQRAKNEADYTLRRRQEETNRLMAGGTLAGAASSDDLARLMSQFNAASGAQGAGRTRTQDFFENTYRPASFLSGMGFNGLQGAVGSDEDLMQSFINLLLGGSAEGQRGAERGQNKFQQQLALLTQAFGNKGATPPVATPPSGLDPDYVMDPGF